MLANFGESLLTETSKKKKTKKEGASPGLLYSTQEEGIKMAFSYSLSSQHGDGMASSNYSDNSPRGSPNNPRMHFHNNIEEEVPKFRQLGD